MSPFTKIAVIQTLHSEPDIFRIETTECVPARNTGVKCFSSGNKSKVKGTNWTNKYFEWKKWWFIQTRSVPVWRHTGMCHWHSGVVVETCQSVVVDVYYIIVQFLVKRVLIFSLLTCIQGLSSELTKRQLLNNFVFKQIFKGCRQNLPKCCSWRLVHYCTVFSQPCAHFQFAYIYSGVVVRIHQKAVFEGYFVTE